MRWWRVARRRVAGADTRERGAVTAELALGLPLLLAITVGMVWLLSVAAAQVQIVDASREAARALARGDDESASLQVARRIAPAGARVTVRRDAGHVVVTTRARVKGPGGLFRGFPAVVLESEATALAESS